MFVVILLLGRVQVFEVWTRNMEFLCVREYIILNVKLYFLLSIFILHRSVSSFVDSGASVLVGGLDLVLVRVLVPVLAPVSAVACECPVPFVVWTRRSSVPVF